MKPYFLFDWGNTLMRDDPAQTGPMWQWPQVFAIPGADEALRWATANGSVGIASGAQDSKECDIRAALERVDLAHYIAQIFCSRTLGYGKTDPRFWQSITQQLQLPPQHIIVIGDHYQADVLTPQAAGLRAIWFNARHEPAQPCLSITRLQELPALIGPDLLKS